MAGKDPPADRDYAPIKSRGLLYPGATNLIRAAVLATRPVQWIKSALVFLPLAFSLDERWTFGDTELLGELLLRALAGAVIFTALSGGVYIVNDLFDRERDRAHPRKRHRPVASGDFPLPAAQALAVVLIAASLTGGFLLGTGFGIACAVFLAINLGYSSFLKGAIILDVMMVSAGYILRVVAGAQVIDVEASPWLYTTIGLGALFIALSKRYSELKSAGTNASSQRSVLEQYSKDYLSQLISVTSTATLVAYALYTFEAANVPENHSMMLTIPFVVFGLFRYLYLVNHTDDAESPELVIIRDRPLLASVLLWVVTAIVILAVDRG